MSSSGKDSEPDSWVKVIDVRRSSQHNALQQTTEMSSFFEAATAFPLSRFGESCERAPVICAC